MEFDVLNSATDCIWATYTELGCTAYQAGDMGIAEIMFAAARDEARRRGFCDWRWETSLRNLARISQTRGNEEGSSALNYGMNSWSKLTEHSTAVRLKRLEELAESYTAVGRYFRASNLYRQLIELIEEIFGPRHPSIVPRLLRLSWVCSMQKKHSQALEIYRRAQAIAGGEGCDV